MSDRVEPAISPRILLVDDDLRLRSRLIQAFLDRGHHVVGAGSVAEALTQAPLEPWTHAIVDLRLPGVTVRPIVDLTGDAHFSEVFFDSVALQSDALVGEEGQGWSQVNAELAFERSGPERLYSSIVLLDAWLRQLRRHKTVSPPPLETLGRLAAHLATLRQLSISVTAKLAGGESPVVEAALVKDIGTEFEQLVPTLVEAALGADPLHPPDAELLRTTAYVAAMAPTFSLRGGTREILRGMIARGLGLR